MSKFLAVTSRGLKEALLEEIRQLDFKSPKITSVGVEFDSNWQGCFKANTLLSTATRILKPILDFPAYNNEELYQNVLKKHDFTKYISPQQTIAVEASVSQSSFHDQRFVALKVKDAIVDQFRDRFGERPDVDKENPHLKIFVRVYKNQVSMSLDTTGESLSQRGYRRVSVPAPLREHLAAGLLHYTGWKPHQALVDPMCGSGTFLIEAAYMAMGYPPSRLRRSPFSFEHWLNQPTSSFHKISENPLHVPIGDVSQLKLFGFDAEEAAIKASIRNSELAQVRERIQWKHRAIQGLSTIKGIQDLSPGVLMVNPPYAERLGDSQKTFQLYEQLGKTLKEVFKGWDCWVLSGNEDLTAALKLKAVRKIPVFNGPIECRFLHYPIR